MDEPVTGERDHLREAPAFRLRLEWPGGEYFLGVTEGGFSLYVGSELAFHFDLEGRLRRAFKGGERFLRGLDGKVLRRTRPGKVGDRIPLETATEVFQLAHDAVTGALAELAAPAPAGPNAATEARELLGRAARYTPARLEEEARRFLEVYEPLSIIPPDRYKALILQATVGCSYGKCAFCTLYRDVAYRRKTPEEFREHVRAVKRFLGRALPLRSGVFLGEANAIEIPMKDLERMLESIHEELPEQVTPGPGRRGGISAFTDVFHENSKSRADLERLSSLGLDRVYLGIESGDDEVLKSLRKPVTREAAARRVRALKEAGLPVGVIFLVGAGGHPQGRSARAHVEGTASLVGEFRLDTGDVVYLSPLYWESPPQGVDQTQLQLTEAEIAEEERELTERLRAQGIRVSRYDLRSFVYY